MAKTITTINVSSLEVPTCRAQSPNRAGEIALSFPANKSTDAFHTWSGCELLFDPLEVLVLRDLAFPKPPLCRLNNTIHRLRIMDTISPLGIATIVLLVALIVALLIAMTLLTFTITQLKKQEGIWRQENSALRALNEQRRAAESELLQQQVELVTGQTQCIEMISQTLLLLSVYARQNKVSTDVEVQLQRATSIILKYRGACGLSQLVPVQLRTATLPRIQRPRPRSTFLPQKSVPPSTSLRNQPVDESDYSLSLPRADVISPEL